MAGWTDGWAVPSDFRRHRNDYYEGLVPVPTYLPPCLPACPETYRCRSDWLYEETEL